jgi:putative transposase
MKTHSAGCFYHLVFTTKYRRTKFDTSGKRALIASWIRQAAGRKHITIEALEIMPDHVHVLAGLPPSVSVAQAVHRMKWWASLRYRQEFISDSVTWGRRYWVRTVGSDHTAVERYIKEQWQ